MRHSHLLAVATVALSWLVACSDRSPSSTNADCAPGEVAIDGSCHHVCTSDLDCTTTGEACLQNVCTTCDNCRQTPEVLSVNGTGNLDPNPDHAERYVNGTVVLTGAHLDGAGVTLSGGAFNNLTLTACAGATDTQLQVQLPGTLEPQVSYTLQVANQSGSCTAAVTFLQGEKGDPGDPADAATVLSMLTTVDGSGSGVDADRLDGLDSSDFVRSSNGSVSGDLAVSGSLQAGGAVFTGPVEGVPRGRNLINWTSDLGKWELLDGSPAVALNTDSVEGADSFEISDNTATVGSTLFYGDFIPVSTRRQYVERVSANVVTGPGTGRFSAGYAAYDANKQPVPDATSNLFFNTASDVVLAPGSGWHHFRGTVYADNSAAGKFPAGTRFVRPVVRANYFDPGSGTGTTLVDGLELFEIQPRNHYLVGKIFKLYDYPNANVTMADNPNINLCATTANYIGCATFQMVGVPHSGGAYSYSTGPKAVTFQTGNVNFVFKTSGASVYVEAPAGGSSVEIEISSSIPIWPEVVTSIPGTVYTVGAL